MSSDAIHIVQALLETGVPHKEGVHDRSEVPRGPVVTISRTYGSGGRVVADRLAEALHVKVFDKELLDQIVEKSKVDRFLMEELDEHVRGTMSDWVYAILTGKNVFSVDYRRHLFSVVLGIARRGGVIVGRGANLILQDHKDVLHVRVVGSPEKCAQRIAEREHLLMAQARDRVAEVNREREIFIHALFKKRMFDPADFDLTLNSDRFDVEQMTRIVIESLVLRGIPVPEAAAAMV